VHESGVVADMMRRVEQAAKEAGQVRRLRFRIGALSGVTPDGLRHGVDHYAETSWGYVPEVVVERSADPTDPDALGVLLVSIGFD
jgi:Zn finger protein HypA/HybF involved in hydrogenase expression